MTRLCEKRYRRKVKHGTILDDASSSEHAKEGQARSAAYLVERATANESRDMQHLAAGQER